MPMTPAPEEVFTIAPPPCLSMRGISYFMERKTPREVDLDDPVPLLQVVVRGRSRLPRLNARVIEGEIQAPEGFDGLVQSRLYVPGPCHVAPDGERPAALFLDHAGRSLVILFGNVGHHHARSFTSKRHRSRTTDAAASRSCHKCHFSCQSFIHLSRHKLSPNRQRRA